MRHHRFVVPAVIGALALGACSRTPAPEAVEPTPIPTADANDEDARRAAEAARRAEEERRAREEAERDAARMRAILEEMVHFDYDMFNIRADAERVLLEKVAVLRTLPNVRLRVDGHADERGSVEYNLALGMRRANAVKEFLTAYGLDPNRFEVQSFGKGRPLIAESNERAWARNRRAEFHITAGAEQLGSARR